jgi:DNA-binding LacI/PurR family transcriptional regulator
MQIRHCLAWCHSYHLKPFDTRRKAPPQRRQPMSSKSTLDLSQLPPPPQRPQMSDIAAALGVSVATVSRAFHGSTLVSQSTRDKVQALAKHWNYTVNLQAQNLRLGQNKTIALVIPFDPDARQAITDPFFLNIMGQLADALTEAGYDMLVSRVSAQNLDECANVVLSGRAAGIVMIGQWLAHERLNHMAQRKVPLVVWGEKLEDQAYCSVGSDNRLGGQMATEHLLQEGHERLVFVGDRALPEARERHHGFCDAMDAKLGRGSGAAARVVTVPFEANVAMPVLRAHLQDMAKWPAGVRPQAYVCASDLLAMTLVNLAREQGMSVPEHLSVVGYDDVALAAYSNPPLTTIHQPITDAAARIVALMAAQLQSGVATSEVMAPRLVVRQSCRRV